MKFLLLKKRFGSAEAAYKASLTLLEQVIGPSLAARFNNFRRNFDINKKEEEIKVKKHILVLTEDSPGYPVNLKRISDPPICLYAKGNIDSVCYGQNVLFGIVGTRKPTSYGQQITYKFSSELSRHGFVIVSGLAIGIDTIAHRAALQTGGKTIAVLGCGVDVIYPQCNQDLYQEITEGGGVVFSEFPPGLTVMKGLFVARNRIISGISSGVLVVEGAKESGSLITARYAAEQGREVFAPPSPITSSMSDAPNILLKQGAKFTTHTDDILDELGIKKGNPHRKLSSMPDLPQEEKQIVEILSHESKLADELVVDMQKPVHQILSLLSSLEIKDLIEKDGEGKYQLKLTD